MCACLCTLPGVKQEQESQGLVLTLVEPDARVKVEVVLRLRDLLAHAHPGEGRIISYSVSILYSVLLTACIRHRTGPSKVWDRCPVLSLDLLSQELRISLGCLLLSLFPAGTRDRVVAASVQVLLAPKGAAAGGPQAQLQAIVSKAVEGPYLLSDGSIETTQDALLRCVCESVVKGIRGG